MQLEVVLSYHLEQWVAPFAAAFTRLTRKTVCNIIPFIIGSVIFNSFLMVNLSSLRVSILVIIAYKILILCVLTAQPTYVAAAYVSTSITQFGAICDGVTDSSASFVAFNTWARN